MVARAKSLLFSKLLEPALPRKRETSAETSNLSAIMASSGCRTVDLEDVECDLDIITPEEMKNYCEVGNEQTWLCWPAGSNPNSFVDLSEFLQVQSSVDDKERLYRTVLELESSKGGGIDTRTFTRPKKMSPYRPLQRVSEPVCHTSFQPKGEVNNKYSIFSNSPPRKDVSRLKDLTNSSFDMICKKPQTSYKIPCLDDWNITEQSLLSEMSTPSFLSYSDSDDGMSENIPSIPSNTKGNELKLKRVGKSTESKSLPQSFFEPSSMSSPAIQPRNRFGDAPADTSLQFNSTEVLNSTMNSEKSDALQMERGLQFSPQKSPCPDRLARTLNDSRVSNSYTDLKDAEESPKSSPRRSGLRRLSHNNTFRLLKSDDVQHFKSVESGLDSTFELPLDPQRKMNNNGIRVDDPTTLSSTGNLRRSVGDVHLAAQQQEYELRHSSIGTSSTASGITSSLKSPMKKVMSETCLFSPNDERKLHIPSNHHNSVTNLPSNNNLDNGNVVRGSLHYPTLLLSANTKKVAKNIGGESLECSKSAVPKTKSRIPSRLPTRMPRLQPGATKMASDWSKGCS